MTEHDSFLALHQTLLHLIKISDEDWREMQPHLTSRRFAKRERMLWAGQPAGVLWFLAEGLVRNYYLTPDGKEFNKSFISAPGFCGSMGEVGGGQPSRFFIETLEDSLTLVIPIPWFRQTSENNLAFQKLYRMQAESLARRKEEREAEFLLDDAATRYMTFRNDHPGLEKRLPAYHVASYLGITEVALSRLKGKLKEKS